MANPQSMTIKAREVQIGDELLHGFVWLPVRAIVPSFIMPGWLVLYLGPVGFIWQLHHQDVELAVRRSARNTTTETE